MSNHVLSIIEIGLQGLLVPVECRITNGLPAIVIVGYANKSLEEAKERLRGAFNSSQLELPRKRITLNLAPGDVPKDGTSFDLAMAIAILLHHRKSLLKQLAQTIIVGELSLDGDVRPIQGIIGKLLAAKRLGIKDCFVPTDNLKQAQLVPGLTIYPVNNLRSLYEHLLGLELIPSRSSNFLPRRTPIPHTDLQTIADQPLGKRALEIAASGGHHLLLTGPPGNGKTMLARALTGILPPLNIQEQLEVTHLHSLSSNNFDRVFDQRPFRAPHHSSSLRTLLGGGNQLLPGEISLSHHGVLFLDELLEFQRTTLEALRQPIEDGTISLTRNRRSTTFPAQFMLVAASNPCPCGYHGTEKDCQCPPHLVNNYQKKLSGPLLDRLDLFVKIEPPVHRKILQSTSKIESSAVVQARVTTARTRQQQRQTNLNGQLSNHALQQHAHLTRDAKAALHVAASKFNISARSYIKTIKVARTIADLADSPQIEMPHMLEALQFRNQTA